MVGDRDVPPSIAAAFRARAERAPGVTALDGVTYSDLLTRVNAIGCALRAEGMQRGDVVAASTGSAADAIATALAALDNEGIAAVIDHTLPARRQQALLAALDAQFVGTVRRAAARDGGAGPGCAFVIANVDGALERIVHAERDVADLLQWHREQLNLCDTDRVAFLRQGMADAWPELLAPIVAGATLLFEAREDATVVYTTPSNARNMLAVQLHPVAYPALRWTVFSGAPLTAHVVEQWRRSYPNGGRVLNLYGRIEVGGTSSAGEVPNPAPAGLQSIGRARRGVALRVAADGRACSDGEIGEIIVNEKPTGDLGRRHADGSITVEGRRDREVKLGGRVQPAEIERALATVAGVDRAVVTCEAGVSGEPRLSASVAADVPPQMITAALRELLPRWMIPAIVPADATAVTPRPNRGPEDPIELGLCRIWEALLKTESVGVRDDFFALGGHSLLAVHLVARIRSRFGVRLNPADLLPHATIERLADRIRNSGGDPRGPLVTIQAGEAGPRLFCVHPSGGSVLCYIELARALGASRPLYGLRSPGVDDENASASDAPALAALYAGAIRPVQACGPYFLAGYSFGGLIAWEMAQQIVRAGDHVTRVVLFDTRFPREYTAADRNPTVDLGEVLERYDLDADRIDERREHALWEELTALAERYVPPAYGKRRMHRVQEFCRTYRLLPMDAELGYADLRAYMRALRANFRVLRQYRPQPAPCPVVLFSAIRSLDGGSSDHVRNASLWRAVSPCGFDVHTLDAHHFSVLSAPTVDAIAGTLGSLLEAGPRRDP